MSLENKSQNQLNSGTEEAARRPSCLPRHSPPGPRHESLSSCAPRGVQGGVKGGDSVHIKLASPFPAL